MRGALRQSGGDVVLVRESAEDLLPADPDLGEVDRFGRVGAGLGRPLFGNTRPLRELVSELETLCAQAIDQAEGWTAT